MVVEPVVGYLDDRGFRVTVGSADLGGAERLARGRRGVETAAVDAGDPAQLRAHVAAADLVISLVPAPLHPGVAEACIDLKVRNCPSTCSASDDVTSGSVGLGRAC